MIRNPLGTRPCALLAITLAACTAARAADNTDNKTPPATSERPSEDDIRKPLKADEKPQVLSEAIEQWRNKEYRQAGINLTRIINGSKKDELESFSATAEKEAQMSLAALAADAHLESAIKEPSKNGAITIKHVTTYEKEALAKKIEDLYNKAMREPIGAPPTSQAAGEAESQSDRKTDDKGTENQELREINRRLHGGQTEKPNADGTNGEANTQPPNENVAPNFTPVMIADFLGDPKSFIKQNTTPAQCAAFARHIGYTISLNGARLQFDTSIRTNKDARTKLADDKKRLNELRAVVEAAARMTPAQRERMEQMRQRQEEMKQRREQQPQKRSQSSGRGSELEQVIRKTVPGFDG